jgi:hypothetical protein
LAALPLVIVTGIPLALYCFFLFRKGEVVGQTNCQCADDGAAREIGRALSAYHAVEVYAQNRFITRFEHAPGLLGIRSRQAG